MSRRVIRSKKRTYKTYRRRISFKNTRKTMKNRRRRTVMKNKRRTVMKRGGVWERRGQKTNYDFDGESKYMKILGERVKNAHASNDIKDFRINLDKFIEKNIDEISLKKIFVIDPTNVKRKKCYGSHIGNIMNILYLQETQDCSKKSLSFGKPYIKLQELIDNYTLMYTDEILRPEGGKIFSDYKEKKSNRAYQLVFTKKGSE